MPISPHHYRFIYDMFFREKLVCCELEDAAEVGRHTVRVGSVVITLITYYEGRPIPKVQFLSDPKRAEYDIIYRANIGKLHAR